MKHCITIAASG